MFSAVLKTIARSKTLASRCLPRIRSISDKDIFSEVLEEGEEDYVHSCIYKKGSPADLTLLKALKTATVTELPTLNKEMPISALKLPISVDTLAGQPQTLYIRSFYRKLFDILWKTHSSILIGSPGISKSWFQWYIMYRLVNENMIPNLGRNHLGSTSPPKVIIRQVGAANLTLYFPYHDKVYSAFPSIAFLKCFRVDEALYLMEPDRDLVEPKTSHLRTITTCSPDERRYKEFSKSGALKYYMPCWELDELHAVGKFIIEDHPIDDDMKVLQAVDKHLAKDHAIDEDMKQIQEVVKHLAKDCADARAMKELQAVVERLAKDHANDDMEMLQALVQRLAKDHANDDMEKLQALVQRLDNDRDMEKLQALVQRLAGDDMEEVQAFVKKIADKDIAYNMEGLVEKIAEKRGDDDMTKLLAFVKHLNMKSFYSAKEIDDRYHCFGGIMRWVLPCNRSIVKEASIKLSNVLQLHRNSGKVILRRGSDVEYADNTKNPISHFILKYKVKRDGQFKGKDITMDYTSDYILHHTVEWWDQMSDLQVFEAVRRLRGMLNGIYTYEFSLYEIVVAQILTRSCKTPAKLVHVQECKEEKEEFGVQECKEEKEEFGLKEIVMVPRANEKDSMKEGVLYQPVRQNFPVIDFVFKKNERVYGIQVTNAKDPSSRATKCETYFTMYKDLGLNIEVEKIHIYLVPHPKHVSHFVGKGSDYFLKVGKEEEKKREQVKKQVSYSIMKLNFD